MKTIKVKASKDFIKLIKQMQEDKKIRHNKLFEQIKNNNYGK